MSTLCPVYIQFMSRLRVPEDESHISKNLKYCENLHVALYAKRINAYCILQRNSASLDTDTHSDCAEY